MFIVQCQQWFLACCLPKFISFLRLVIFLRLANYKMTWDTHTHLKLEPFSIIVLAVNKTWVLTNKKPMFYLQAKKIHFFSEIKFIRK